MRELPEPYRGDPSLPPVPCPVFGCDGHVFVRRLGGALKCFGCDTDDSHGEAAIRNLWIAEDMKHESLQDELQDDRERRLDPVAWLQDKVLAAQDQPETKFQYEDISRVEELPSYRTGIVGRESGSLLHLRGMTTLSGIASSGKTWFALGAALASAGEGWSVHYLAAEAYDVIKRRIKTAYGDHPPELFNLHSVKPGVTVEIMIQEIAEWITSTKTMLVIDSVSTLMGLMTYARGADKWDEQGRLEMFLMQLRELTRGQVAIINISESNAQGEAKGRTLNHRSDIGIHFKSLDDSDAKEIRIMKAWEGRTGPLGRARVNAQELGLELVSEGPIASNSDDIGGF